MSRGQDRSERSPFGALRCARCSWRGRIRRRRSALRRVRAISFLARGLRRTGGRPLGSPSDYGSVCGGPAFSTPLYMQLSGKNVLLKWRRPGAVLSQ